MAKKKKTAKNVANKKAAAKKITKLRTTAYCLNVRSEPSLVGPVIGVLVRGDVVDGLDVSGDRYWHKIDNREGLRGWASHRYLESLDNESAIASGDHQWMKIAIREIGVREFPGGSDNPRIVQYHQSTSLPSSSAEEDETPWCSSFVNWCLERAGYEGTDSAWARSWLNWGKKITRPTRGCVAVFSRNRGGHVAFYVSHTSTAIKVLGGNQSDAVNIKAYAKSRLLGYRIPG